MRPTARRQSNCRYSTRWPLRFNPLPAAFPKWRALTATIDVLSALAELAVEQSYVRPVVTEGREFHIERGRHPVVEAALARQAQGFVANDCKLSPDGPGRLWLVTGPNMAGKSTFLRQNALVAIMAQMGSFVPAQSATIGLVDRLFSRVGAADDLRAGVRPSWSKWSRLPRS
jgi:DNA mismatch repair protein MutS